MAACWWSNKETKPHQQTFIIITTIIWEMKSPEAASQPPQIQEVTFSQAEVSRVPSPFIIINIDTTPVNINLLFEDRLFTPGT